MLKKGVPFVWSSNTQEAFDTLKTALVQAPVLDIPDFNKQFILETNAGEVGFGVVLMQEGHPMAYLSKQVCPRNQALSSYEKECVAIIMAVEKWRCYLQHQAFVIKTDHRSLLYLTDQRAHTKLQQKALLKLMDLKFTIQYKQGNTNMVADALSRCSPLTTICALSTCTPAWLENLVQGYDADPTAQQLLVELALHPENGQGYSLADGVIRYKGRVWIGNNDLAQQHVLQSLHNSAVGGHSGFQATYHRIKTLFAWPKMKEMIRKYVQSCEVCQQAKLEHVKLPGLL